MVDKCKQIECEILKRLSGINDIKVNNFLKSNLNRIEKIFNIIQNDKKKEERLQEILIDYFKEIEIFLNICDKDNEIEINLRIINEISINLDNLIEGLYQADLMDVNADMKLLENMLKEAGYYEEDSDK